MTATVRLANGAEVPADVATDLWANLQTVWRQHPVSMLELLAAYGDPDHHLLPLARIVLQQYGLLDPTGGVLPAVRDLLASALVGEGLDQQLGSPWAAETPGGVLR